VIELRHAEFDEGRDEDDVWLLVADEAVEPRAARDTAFK
jgi:hypothetical protein